MTGMVRYRFCSCRSLAVALTMLCITGSATAQTILERYKWLRTNESARSVFRERGLNMIPLGTDPLGVKSDSIRAWILAMQQSSVDSSSSNDGSLLISQWYTVSVDDIPDFRAMFDSTKWAFLGSTSLAAVDTMRTNDLRSRLEFRFGPPTRTLAEAGKPENLRRSEIIQFEYWIVLNDTIPIVVIDVNGPWDRGLVMASSHRYRVRLAEIRKGLLGQLAEGADRKPFADYYYNPEQQLWYVSGFDGASFFDVRIGPPNLSLGRPKLEEYMRRED